MPCRPCKYIQWSRSSLHKAVSELEKGNITSARRAALLYGIPRSTPQDHVIKKVAKPGLMPYLSTEEEEELVNFQIKCSRISYPKTRTQVLAIVQETISKRHPDISVTNGWWERFSRQHPGICLKTAIPLSYVHAMGEGEALLDSHSDILETTLLENDLFDRPGHIFICDKTGKALNPKPLKSS